ncbi:SDR family NAD(P)-dependent oxidoreductase [Fontibacillus sp. BL9]|uniref:SDR family NAD(P)-dependent oxidoreductase n=1 Tax=Fontibacillus sp. BL9 TaxID=3389971 RepID=UPI0039792A4E
MEYTALVTGADHGVGLALVERLLNQGCRVFAGRYQADESALDQLRLRFEDRLTLVDLDIGSDESVKKAAAAVSELSDSIDILINNAGILGDIEATVLDELDFGEMLKVFNVNALGALRVTQAAVPLLLNGVPKMIVNISSEAGSIGQNHRSSWFAYCMSKAALNMQSSLVYNGLKEAGGRVLIIHPGWVRTFMRGEVDAAAELTPAQSAERIIGLILDRIGRSTEIKSEGDTNSLNGGLEYIDVYGEAMPW